VDCTDMWNTIKKERMKRKEREKERKNEQDTL
jgi:hypothetical protein